MKYLRTERTLRLPPIKDARRWAPPLRGPKEKLFASLENGDLGPQPVLGIFFPLSNSDQFGGFCQEYDSPGCKFQVIFGIEGRGYELPNM